jgi:hypothetical protein
MPKEPTEGAVTWPSAVVAMGILVLIGAITVSAVWKYNNIDDALKFWTALAALVGVVTGAFVAFFFTTGSTAEAQRVAADARAESAEARRALEEAHTTASKALDQAARAVADRDQSRLEGEAHVEVARALEKIDKNRNEVEDLAHRVNGLESKMARLSQRPPDEEAESATRIRARAPTEAPTSKANVDDE